MRIEQLLIMKGCKYIMKINKITIEGFKNLDRTEVELNDINGILSINNYGKSNLLQGINFGFDFIVEGSKTKQNMMKWQAGIPIIKTNFGKNYKFEIEFDEDINNEKYSAIYGYEFEWYQSKTKPNRIICEYLKIKKYDNTQKYTLVMERNDHEGLYKSSTSGRCDKVISIGKDELIINKLKSYDDLYYLQIIESICQLEFYIDRHFDSDELYGVSPIIEKNTNELSPTLGDGRGIARALYNLKKEDKNKYELIINSFTDFFPDIEKVSIKEIDLTKYEKGEKIPDDAPFEYADYAYMLLVKNKHIDKYLNFKLMSDGAKRILSILTCITLAERKKIPLVAIEEPENSVHPGLLRKYIDILEQFTDNFKIILTSHSPNLINYMSLKDLYLGVPKKDGSAQFCKLKSTYYNRINEYSESMGMMTGEYLFDLMSSYDDKDIETLKKYLNYEQNI